MASGPITSWQIDGETMKTVRNFIFLGSKITADGDCSHEIKRHLLLGRKATRCPAYQTARRGCQLSNKLMGVRYCVYRAYRKHLGTLRSESEIRGTLRVLPQLEMRPSSNAPSPVESREAPPTSSFPGFSEPP